ncbi:tRNA threonylcarbamoyl adenosine modification protein (Sua5/YciO/YrdC/YwlC family) [Arcanobacterium pluranimalium]|uniref:L-threonylcarbamoyladenylate synthase n=1 Tax=Arcanobacterium pluranimalium TaxID=108028 RepID=UPI00195B38C3|nr:L-threonylcarbamoyladenylate synthase [Arcanobacterium pluranimalium]MBM7825560.1 tRNA threonylcarbamoyl adenosine modification protein (Sua5/YciO/YrdC/YwlC family) [Arcanobacterium pluranimalium]
MAHYVDLHPDNPQQRIVDRVVERLRQGDIAAIPTDSGYAIACRLGNKDGLERIRAIRRVDSKHHFTLLCHDFGQLGKLVIIDNANFRLIKSKTPGPFTFILKATKEVPRMMLNPKKSTVGVRIPDHKITQAILETMDEPLLCSTLILPGETEPQREGWQINDELGHVLDIVVEGPIGAEGPTTVVDLSSGSIEILREGAGRLDTLA